ncbi:6-phosphogluconolactonase [Cognataquiflexum rubidum]|uniref:6-phosphogluconolactonase n=1 Tax=Cognataquiflexum rubidum TaxID=2922273 RepID=UPI001F1350C8|nr:6-phosphogluconolactonase [Cognataquiflexum rubidum]MCH6232381.1 6-phosphogluconolactonase [Cognataquiflexum rubidum]
MKITYLENYDSLSQYAAKLVMDEVQLKRDMLFCAATGNSPTGMYAEMAKNKSLFDRMRVVKMDEWGIIPLSHPDSCESYIKKHVLEPMEIPTERYVGFDTAPESVAAECTRMQNFISEQGPFDICILGFGKNAHIAFNEPADFLQPDFHKATLAPSTIQHDPALSQGPEPAYGLCVGMKDILETRKIIFLITGKGKQEAIKQILERKISTQCPASFLWMHPNVECLIDKNSL